MVELHLRPTDKLVMLALAATGVEIQARIWQGKTATGIPVHAFISRVAVEKGRPAHEYTEFQEALKETEAPRPEVAAIDMRLIL